jgi:restriction system protein
LFVTVGEYSADAHHIERNNSRLRLLGGEDLVSLIFAHYDRFEPRFKAALPLKRTYTPDLPQAGWKNMRGG